jgi:hypothetical protein
MPKKHLRNTNIQYLAIDEFAKFDLYRKARTGIPEFVIAEGKKLEHLLSIIREVIKATGKVILTRVDKSHIPAIRSIGFKVRYEETARVCIVTSGSKSKRTDETEPEVRGKVGIITAGTADVPVAEEAKVVAEILGCEVFTAYDVGVAGIHRLADALKSMVAKNIDVYIVAAGREGALPTFVAGLVNSPVIGVPISTGYGMGSSGKSALYAMLQSCSPLVVVNIDAGFVAGAVAAQIANKIALARRSRLTNGNI